MLIKEGYDAARNAYGSVVHGDGYEAQLSNYAAVETLRTLEYNFKAALSLAKKLDAHRNTLDFVLRDYAAPSKRSSWIFHTIELPVPVVMLEFAKLGASRPAVEALAKELARCGLIGPLLEATRILKRKPEEAEIIMLVDDYLKGATQGDETERKLIELARGVSRDLAERMENKISARRYRLSLCAD